MSGATSPIAAASFRPGVVRELAGCRSFYALQSSMLAVSAGLAASQVAWVGGSVAVLGSGGVGFLWVAFFLGWACTSVPAGVLVDRGHPGRWLIGGCTASGLALIAIGGLLAAGSLNGAAWMGLAAVTGAAQAFELAAVVKVQATLVPATATGAAEIVRVCRDAIGVAAGSLLLGTLFSPAVMTMVGGVLFLSAGVAVAILLRRSAVMALSGRPDPGAADGPPADRMRDVAAAARADPRLRSAAISRLVMIAATPTMLISLMLVDLRVPELSPELSAAVAIGGVLGTLTLTAHGLHVRRRRRLLVSFGLFATLMLVSALMLIGDWLLAEGWRRVAVIVLAALAGGLPAYGNGLLAGLVQQRSPDRLRGKIIGLLQVPMLLMQSLAGLFVTGVVTDVSSIGGLVISALVIYACILGLRGFRSIR